jgi:hypothetical protein
MGAERELRELDPQDRREVITGSRLNFTRRSTIQRRKRAGDPR